MNTKPIEKRHCDSLLTRKVTNAGFQLYTTVREILVAEIPDSLPLANAAVLPLSVSTAASALYVQLDLPFPSLSPKSTGKRIVIWGGSSSVGSSAIQLAVASGLEVVATASQANHDLVRSLGASQVFDHRAPSVIDQMASVLQPGDYVVDCIGSPDTQAKCGELVGRIGGGTLPVMLWPQGGLPQNVRAVFGESDNFLFASSKPVCMLTDILQVNGLDPGMVNLDVGNAVWRKFIPEALAAGKFQAKPDPRIVPGGLEKVQEGIDMLRQGVSAQKIVIEISRSE
ncbi:NAD(P)-binding protein [Aspergillus japonicus CBS 114.51]|uniref:NAD(P)-binding protein n=1 Tax=Aspergillus japonicus CBS 114.51 TaxID=1448312 RepID=A0A8T8X1I5_ASPJA|nr:NAD(P)-binding protein [Aspergillus japonicus CBS 114.51]RAH81760.1 NAD(P)-binding protein [Aspergillus japonicus CBS 114.51]